MSIYDKSSLVLIPSGTKTSKVYSQKPTNGDGDFDFTRSTAATRIAANGNIEKETQNLLLQSNSFNTSPWNLSSATMSGGQSGYDGSSDAWIFTTSVAGAANLQSFSSTGVLTYSVYAKAGSVNGIRLRIDTNSDADGFFNLVNGTIFQSSGIDASIEDVGGGWYRCSLAHNVAGPVKLQFFTTNGTTSYDNGSIYIQDAQLNQGLIAQEVITTTTTALYGGITDNVPRLDYTDSSCPALLLEPQRTNLVNNSEFFNSWSAGFPSPVRTNNYGISPEGVQNSTRADIANGGIIYRSPNASQGAYVFSVFAKNIQGGGSVISLRVDAPSAYFAVFDLSNGTIVSNTSDSAKIEDYGNGWYRCMLIQNNDQILNVVIGEGTTELDCELYGAQLEAGSYATSYIPTYGTSVTRVADACSKTGVSSLIGQTEGTMYYEFNSGKNDGADYVVSLSDGSANNRIVIYRSAANQLIAQIRTSAVTYAQLNTSVITENVVYKVALGYANNDVVFYVNGVQIGADTSATIPLTNRIATDNSVGSATFGRPINQLLLFKTRLSNEELATLTTI